VSLCTAVVSGPLSPRSPASAVNSEDIISSTVKIKLFYIKVSTYSMFFLDGGVINDEGPVSRDMIK
jgi:hypothetical protein